MDDIHKTNADECLNELFDQQSNKNGHNNNKPTNHSNQSKNGCECGCPDDCGCKTGGECTCGDDCTCRDENGKCTCNTHSNTANCGCEDDCGCTKDNDSCGCTTNSSCGCGADCDCGDDCSCTQDNKCNDNCTCDDNCDCESNDCNCESDCNCEEDCNCAPVDKCDDNCDCDNLNKQKKCKCGCGENLDDCNSHKPNHEKQPSDDAFNSLLRLQAEFDNYRKRTEKEKATIYHNGFVDAITDFLPALDSFKMAKEYITDKNTLVGIEYIEKGILKTLEKMGVTTIDATGKFDPNFHQAIDTSNADGFEVGDIVKECYKGFKIGDKVIRFSQVIVKR